MATHFPLAAMPQNPHILAFTPQQVEAMFSALAFYSKQGWDGGKKAQQAFVAIDNDGGVVLVKGAGND